MLVSLLYVSAHNMCNNQGILSLGATAPLKWPVYSARADRQNKIQLKHTGIQNTNFKRT